MFSISGQICRIKGVLLKGDRLAGFKIKEQTRARCKIVELDAQSVKKFVPISLELFPFLYQATKIDFSLYFRIGQTLIEYIKPSELSKELLDEMWQAMHSPRDGLHICILRSDRDKYNNVIAEIRKKKISSVQKVMPYADQKTIDLYAQLSNASQLIVSGGIDANVVQQVKASAAFMVTNVIDSDAAISTLSRMIICDPTLYDHCAAVAMIATVIGQRILDSDISVKEAELLAQCALYHDVGKTCVPNAILNKPGKFTPEEYEIMKTHASLGFEELTKLIESGASIDTLVARVAHEHHEKWDGKGYPRGLKGAAEIDPDHGIHRYSRIVTVSDIYSALLMKRVYKAAFEPQDAIKIMAQEASGFDPGIFIPFLKGVVHSLNSEQTRLKDKGRILVFDEKGELSEWTDSEKKVS